MIKPTVLLAAIVSAASAASAAEPAAQVAALAYRPDGKVLAAGGIGEVVFVNTADGKPVGRLDGLDGVVTALAYSRDGSRLAVGVSKPGRSGTLRIYPLKDGAVPADAKPVSVRAHKDSLHAVAFSPDGKAVATCGYDRLAKLHSAADGKPLHTLADHSDSVYGLTFSPDGALLATCAADRTVKIWRTADGVRLYSLSEATDWLYAVSWSPDGKTVAAAGVDKSLRTWAVSAAGGTLEKSAFAHDGPVVRLAHSPDGKTIYTVGEDRSLKAWDAGTLLETRVFERQPEHCPAFAVRPDGKQLAVGRHDGSASLYDAATGKRTADPLPVKPEPPVISAVAPAGFGPGWSGELTLTGKHLRGRVELAGLPEGVTLRTPLPHNRSDDRLVVTLSAAATAKPGVYPVAVRTAGGTSGTLPLVIDPFATVNETEPNDSRGTAQPLALPATVAASAGRDGDTDWFAFDAPAGTEIGVQVVADGIGSKLAPRLALLDAAGDVLAEGNGSLGYRAAAAGRYVLKLRDAEYRGGAGFDYRLSVGPLPVITGVFPPGLRAGSSAELAVRGVNLQGAAAVRVDAAAAKPGARLPVTLKLPDGRSVSGPSALVGEFPEVVAAGDPAEPTAMSVPGTANGVLDRPGAARLFRFEARRGRPLIVEIDAERLGSRLDSVIEILDTAGRPVPRAVLRCLARCATTFRDHDSAGTGIRIDNWAELAVNDYVMIGGSELARIRELPKNPDDDMRFWSVRNRRTGFLDTTPTQHANGTPVFKVAMFPPGTTFPPNGMPVFEIPYRNDDAQPGGAGDSRLAFDPPADGTYLVRVSDVRGEGGPDFAFRLTVREPRPDFAVSASPTNPSVWKGGAVPVNVTLDRTDGFAGAVRLRLENLPAGYSAPETDVPAGELTTAFALSAAADAAAPPKNAPAVKLVATAVINGKTVVREAPLGLPKPAEPGDLTVTTSAPEVTVVPGKSVWLKVTIERRNKFNGRVPLEVRGLPHGVRVLDIGLNGILITPRETARDIEIYAEPWAEPTSHPFVILARREGRNSEHAAPPVLLKVAPAPAVGRK